MTNVTRITGSAKAREKHWWSSKWAKIGIAAGTAGIVAAIILATHGSKRSHGNYGDAGFSDDRGASIERCAERS